MTSIKFACLTIFLLTSICHSHLRYHTHHDDDDHQETYWLPVAGSLTEGRDIERGEDATCPLQLGRIMPARGFHTKSEPDQGPHGDNSALNGIRFMCWARRIDEEKHNFPIEIRSLEGNFGANWNSQWDMACRPEDNTMVGVIMRVHQEDPRDASGATNMAMICRENLQTKDGEDTRPWGVWTHPQTICNDGDYVCGFRTYVQREQGPNGDDMGLTGMDIQCCVGPGP